MLKSLQCQALLGDTSQGNHKQSQWHVDAQADAVAGFSLLNGTPGVESRTLRSRVYHAVLSPQ